MMILFKYLLLSLCFISSITLAADNISELVLSNGLKIIVKPDQRSPIAVFQIWYKVGSANEQQGYTGISHLLEHLMYRGMKNPSLDAVYREIDSIGTQGNAYTGRDHTFYYHILGNKYLPLAFAVEAERMKNLVVDINDFKIEKNVIHEEWSDSISKDPYLPASNALYHYAFQYEAYQFPVIGQMADQDALTLPLVLNWHRVHYTPDNATLVIVGDIKTSAVFALARKYFSGINKKAKISPAQLSGDKKNLLENKLPDKTLPEKKLPVKKTVKRFIMPETTKVAMILLAFKVPSIKTSEPAWEAYALDVLAGWFDSGFHSRLTKALIRDRQVAHEVFVHYSPMNRKQSLFIIEATPANNVSVQQLEQAIIAEIKQIRNEVISPETLQKVKNQMIATEIFERDSMYIQAKIIGQAESVGIPWSEDAQYMSRIKAVTTEQVNTVLQQYINLDKQFIVIQNAHDTEMH